MFTLPGLLLNMTIFNSYSIFMRYLYLYEIETIIILILNEEIESQRD